MIIIDIESRDKLKGYIFPTIIKNNYSSKFPLDQTFEYNCTKTEFIFPEQIIENNENFVIFIKLDSKFSLKVELNKENDGNNDNKFPE